MDPILTLALAGIAAAPGVVALAIALGNRRDVHRLKRELSEGEGEPIDWLGSVELCPHGIPDGDWCPTCREAVEQARIEADGERE